VLRGCTTSGEQWIFFVYFIDENGSGRVACSDEFSLGPKLEGLSLILGLLIDWVCQFLGYANVSKHLTIVPGGQCHKIRSKVLYIQMKMAINDYYPLSILSVMSLVLNLPTRYRKLIGELLYLPICTRPDISYTINALAQHSMNPFSAHYATAKHLLQYLAGTLNLRMSYGGDRVDESLHAFCHADWASSPEDHLSISGYAWFYAGLIAHVSKKQLIHALSSTEAEYMAITHVIQEGLWIQSLFNELHLTLVVLVVIHIDNTGGISLSKEAKIAYPSKHIDVRYHFIRGHIENGTFLPKWLLTTQRTPSSRLFRILCF